MLVETAIYRVSNQKYFYRTIEIAWVNACRDGVYRVSNQSPSLQVIEINLTQTR